MIKEELVKELYENQDLGYKEFSLRIVPTKYEMIGVRLPVLKTIAKRIAKSEYINEIQDMDTDIYEAIMVQGLAVACSKIKIDNKIKFFNDYVNKIDNWAICDSVSTSLKNKDEVFYEQCLKWIKSKKEFTVRFGIINLMSHFIDEKHVDNTIRYLLEIEMTDYYIQMAIAWYIQRLYFYDKTKAELFLDNQKLNDSIKKKAMQKIRDSKRERKTYKEI